MSVEPARHNFKIFKGATFQYRLTYLQGGVGSSPQDLSGYSALLLVKDSAGATLLSLTPGSGIQLGGAAGTIDLIVSNTQTAALSWTNGNYKLSVTSATNVEDILLFGNVTVTAI